jgi:hypothetical protein
VMDVIGGATAKGGAALDAPAAAESPGKIMSEIRRARFVLADHTGQVNSAYFEAGFALGFGLTVIPTCRARARSC